MDEQTTHRDDADHGDAARATSTSTNTNTGDASNYQPMTGTGTGAAGTAAGVGTFDKQVHTTWTDDLRRDERAAILAWGSFTATFALVRGLTHWLKDGHGPSSGGITLGGQHFHHYNLGIAGLTALGSLVVQAEARERIGEHPALPIAYGVSTALIVDEAALLLDLKDVYWAKQGRTSVDIAVGAIGSGGFLIALLPLANRLRRRRHG